MVEYIRTAGSVLFRYAFRASPARTAVASFGVAILIGSLLLSLPVSSSTGQWTPPVDALFTSTSAVCVTGLLVRSTPGHWSLFGQLVILGMVQIGGLGIMTLGVFVAIMLQRRLSMRLETVMSDIVESHAPESVWTLIRFICLFTLAAEVAGAVVLFLSWRGHFDSLGRCFYHSVFHSISAFCNAGFSLNDNSLMDYADSFSVNLAMCSLIVVGGVGFIVVRDIKQYAGWWLFGRKGRRARLSTHSKLVLLMTGVLLVGGFLSILLLQWDAPGGDGSLRKRLLTAAFQSVTARTAGFNTFSIRPTALAPATAFVLMVLMYIGGSPGGTAGGIKTSTIGIMIASILATLRGRPKAEVFHHSIPEETVHKVASIILLSVGALATGIFLLLITELGTGATFQETVFESLSAFGTVGLSQGLSGPGSVLTAWGKLVLTSLMFVGRLGPITLVLSVAQLKERAVYRYPEDRVLVG